MLKHIGKHGDKKVVILYHTVPNEEHMCLVVYSDLLPRMMHDEIMKCVESAPGQEAKDFADALFRNIMADGRNTLETLHREGLIKKVQTGQVIVTPTPQSSVRLDELNTMLAEIAKGTEAIKRMEEMDKNSGFNGKKAVKEGREAWVPPSSRTAEVNTPVTPVADAFKVLSDTDLAAQRAAQATKMRADAAQLLAEATRLEQEAQSLTPAKVANVRSNTAQKAKKTKTAKAA